MTLLMATARGDHEAFSKLYDLAVDRVYNFCFEAFDCEAEAEDATQEIFAKIWNSAARFDPTIGPARLWVYNIAKNHCADLIRRRATYNSSFHKVQPATNIQQIAKAEQRLDYTKIMNLLRAISPGGAQIISLECDHGYSVSKISQEIGIPEPTLRSKKLRALKSLRIHAKIGKN